MVLVVLPIYFTAYYRRRNFGGSLNFSMQHFRLLCLKGGETHDYERATSGTKGKIFELTPRGRLSRIVFRRKIQHYAIQNLSFDTRNGARKTLRFQS